MGILFSELKQYQPLQKVIVHSLEMALFQVSVVINDSEYVVYEENDELMKALSPLHIQQRFAELAYAQMVLRHSSAYDEMCGQAEKTSSNMLEVPFGQKNLF
jgi:hypothetical protein